MNFTKPCGTESSDDIKPDFFEIKEETENEMNKPGQPYQDIQYPCDFEATLAGLLIGH